jgi:cytochrome c553
MRAQAEHLSNQEIADLAAYFGAQTGLTTRRPNWSCDG